VTDSAGKKISSVCAFFVYFFVIFSSFFDVSIFGFVQKFYISKFQNFKNSDHPEQPGSFFLDQKDSQWRFAQRRSFINPLMKK
jgi:hypothetical protein